MDTLHVDPIDGPEEVEMPNVGRSHAVASLCLVMSYNYSLEFATSHPPILIANWGGSEIRQLDGNTGQVLGVIAYSTYGWIGRFNDVSYTSADTIVASQYAEGPGPVRSAIVEFNMAGEVLRQIEFNNGPQVRALAWGIGPRKILYYLRPQDTTSGGLDAIDWDSGVGVAIPYFGGRIHAFAVGRNGHMYLDGVGFQSGRPTETIAEFDLVNNTLVHSVDLGATYVYQPRQIVVADNNTLLMLGQCNTDSQGHCWYGIVEVEPTTGQIVRHLPAQGCTSGTCIPEVPEGLRLSRNGLACASSDAFFKRYDFTTALYADSLPNSGWSHLGVFALREKPRPRKGDMNNDWNIDGDDIARFVMAQLGLTQQFTIDELYAADVNNDGIIDANDLSQFAAALLASP